MSDLNSWEDDPAAQDENLARQAQQQLNMGNPQQPQGGSFRPGVASFQPMAQSFQPGQAYGSGGNFAPQYQQQQYYGGQQYAPPQQYGAQQAAYGQYNNQGYAGVYGQQSNHNQGYGEPINTRREYLEHE